MWSLGDRVWSRFNLEMGPGWVVESDDRHVVVEFLDGAGGVHFARTSNWSSTAVQTGSTPVTTQLTLPAGITDGAYRVQAVAARTYALYEKAALANLSDQNSL